MRRAARALQQREVLHVARADLHHVGVTFDQVCARLVNRLGHDSQAELLARLCENLQALFAQTLKRVRRSARLERAAPEEARAAPLDGLGHGEDLLAALDRARARDYRQLVAADSRVAADVDDGLLGAQVDGDELVRLRHAYRLGHARQRLEGRDVHGAGVAGDAYGRAPRAGHDVRPVAQLIYDALDLFYLLAGRVNLHHDEHRSPLKQSV